MKRLLLLLALTALQLLPQQPGESQLVKKLYTLKHADPRQIAQVISVFTKVAIPNWETKSLAVEAFRSSIPAIDEALARLDVAPDQRNIDLTVHYLTGSDVGSAQEGALPAELNDVVTQLKKTFAFKHYRLLDSLAVRTRFGQSAEASGVLSGAPLPAILQFKMRAATFGEAGLIHIDRLNVGVRIPVVVDKAKGSTVYNEIGINTDIDLKDGQKVVVGKSSMEGPGKALFVVLTAKVLP